MLTVYLLPGITMNNHNDAYEGSFTIARIMKHLGVGRSTVYEMMADGRLPRGGKPSKRRIITGAQMYESDRKHRSYLFTEDDCSETPEQAARWDARRKTYEAAKKNRPRRGPGRRGRKV